MLEPLSHDIFVIGHTYPTINVRRQLLWRLSRAENHDLRLAVARMLIWALTMGVVATFGSYRWPAQTGALFLRGEAYRAEMFAWVATGQGAESDPSRFIPQQIGHATLFSGLALATGGVAAMPMGAVLRTRTLSEPRGFMKMLIDADSDRILGFTAFGVEASEPMSIVQTAMLANLPYTALRDAIFTHPTVAEGLTALLSSVATNEARRAA